MAELSNYMPIEADASEKPAKKNGDGGPVDRHHIVRVTMYLLGISCLLPWNFFIQASDYWMYKFRNVSAGEFVNPEVKSELQTTFFSYLAIASKVPYVVFLLANSAVATRFSPESRMQYPLAVMILLFVATIVIAPINTDNAQNTFFAITICLVVTINVACGFVQGAGTGIAGSLPKAFMGYTVNGMAVGAILASIAQIATLLGDVSSTTTAILYFACAVLILCITFVLFRITIKTEFYNFYMSKQARQTSAASEERRIHVPKIEVFKKIWVSAVAITLVFWVTLSVLPAVLVLMTSTSPDDTLWTGKLFIPVVCFFLFNICDLGGRITALQVAIPPRCQYLTLFLTVIRIVFVPLIMLCNAQPRHHMPVVFNSDVSLIIIIFFFALTNGYLCNIILIQAPKRVEEELQEQAGTQMAFFLGVGLMLGSVSSYGTVKLL